MSGFPKRAYVVVSQQNPQFTYDDRELLTPKHHSIHLNAAAAKEAAEELRQKVFTTLALGNNSEEFITRMLVYRQSIKVAICDLTKIAVAVAE